MNELRRDETGKRQRVLSRSLDMHEELLDCMPVGVIGLSEDGRVVLYNRRQEDLSGRRREDVIGKPLFEVVAPFAGREDLQRCFARAQPPVELSDSVACAMSFGPDQGEGAESIDAILHFSPLAFADRRLVSIVIEDVTEQNRFQRERDRLLSAMFHDLRAPLSGISVFADICVEGEDMQRDELADAFTQVGSMCTDMIELIDETTRRLRGTDIGDLELFDLAFLAHGVALECALVCRMEGQQLRVNEVPIEVGHVDRMAPVRILASRVEAARCLRNLIGNAAKYAEARIDIGVRAESGRAVLTVEDDGPGVPDGFEQKVFEGGVMAPGAKPGTGLGLETVKLWVDAMQGRVSAGRSQLGGAAFRVELPSVDS